jgi:hypothetical protein
MDWQDDATCPSCGGAGGGPFGPAGSAWDTEDYICPRCKGLGVVGVVAQAATMAAPSSVRPGIAKAAAAPVDAKRAAGEG